jgi:leucine dehydrogenase
MTVMLERPPGNQVFADAEETVLCRDRATGLRAVVAIDDTTRGPGLGGVRFMAYADDQQAVDEARRLARVMTLKNACADLPYGGAKSVIIRDPSLTDRRALMTAFGRFVASLGGRYLPGVDMGTNPEDLGVMAAAGAEVSCDHEDPSPWTALGVLAGIEAAARRVLGTGLEGLRVSVQGTGHVGANLAERLVAAGSEVVVTDIDADRAASVAERLGIAVVGPVGIERRACDVFAPCAGARVITAANVASLGCRIVAGAANDVLSERAVARALNERGITYVPDFLINAGGVIQIHAARVGWDRRDLEAAVGAIGPRVDDALAVALELGQTPLEGAEALASAKLGRACAILEGG